LRSASVVTSIHQAQSQSQSPIGTIVFGLIPCLSVSGLPSLEEVLIYHLSFFLTGNPTSLATRLELIYPRVSAQLLGTGLPMGVAARHNGLLEAVH